MYCSGPVPCLKSGRSGLDMARRNTSPGTAVPLDVGPVPILLVPKQAAKAVPRRRFDIGKGSLLTSASPESFTSLNAKEGLEDLPLEECYGSFSWNELAACCELCLCMVRVWCLASKVGARSLCPRAGTDAHGTERSWRQFQWSWSLFRFLPTRTRGMYGEAV